MPNSGTGSAYDPPTYHATTERENKTAQLRRGDTLVVLHLNSNLCIIEGLSIPCRHATSYACPLATYRNWISLLYNNNIIVKAIH